MRPPGLGGAGTQLSLPGTSSVGKGGGTANQADGAGALTLQVELRDATGALLLQGAQQDPSKAFKCPSVVHGPGRAV